MASTGPTRGTGALASRRQLRVFDLTELGVEFHQRLFRVRVSSSGVGEMLAEDAEVLLHLLEVAAQAVERRENLLRLLFHLHAAQAEQDGLQVGGENVR